MLQNEEEDGGFEFIVRLCSDVLLELLLFGDRRRLTRLERVGRRFHLSIENFFSERPFLRLGLQISAYLFIFNEICKAVLRVGRFCGKYAASAFLIRGQCAAVRRTPPRNMENGRSWF